MKFTFEQHAEAQEYLDKYGRRTASPRGDLYKITMPDGWQFAASDMTTLKERMMMRMFKEKP
jgi:hypothetical protein